MASAESPWTKVGVIAGILSTVLGVAGVALAAGWSPLPEENTRVAARIVRPAAASGTAPSTVDGPADRAVPAPDPQLPGAPGPTATAGAPRTEPGAPRPESGTAAPAPGATTAGAPAAPRIASDETRLATLPCGQEPGFASAQTHAVTSIQFYNQLDVPVDIHWLDFEGKRRPWTSLPARGTVKLQTYLSHYWVATAAGGCVGIYAAREYPGAAIIQR
ncbi:hypothetical protein Val02_01530 [Virgisporangium aliadipatigenens]|uniref:von Hippel-Lindau disease tumour suppressor beta domain-containing protein n=1 Tax=Virgisporangium aliadipatigenens TaxID=741659 RepID=A0A8J3YFE6_9ACTN|nr:hypothetical protein [Virgisporangium aliadipatigenens]GIJ43267.1 hypothetical protein Val02_01530 [Virgisporangium aliadipatigenens]